MTRAYAEIAFTADVLAAQRDWNTRGQAGPALRDDIDPQRELTPAAQAFVAQINTAFIATVGSTGWPYVQHRGGPRGFIRVLDRRQLLLPDHDGNGQLISVGNLRGDDRTMLILMDYAARRRLKLWGRTRVLEGADRMAAEDQHGAPWALLFTVEAMNFNCPGGIPEIADAAFGS